MVLGWDEKLSLQHLRGSDVIASVLSAACYRPQVLDALGAWSDQTKSWLALLKHTPVYRLARPKDFKLLSAACGLVEQLEAIS